MASARNSRLVEVGIPSLFPVDMLCSSKFRFGYDTQVQRAVMVAGLE